MENIERYILEHCLEEDEVLKWIRKQTNLRTNHARMLSGVVQGNLLTILTGMSGAVHALEIGTFTGYSAVCIARGLRDIPGRGEKHLDSLEINDELSDLILEGWKRAGLSDIISLHTGDAMDFLATAPSESYDLVFIDANKRQYRAYYEAVLPLVRKGGAIIADNTLWDGKVVEETPHRDAQTLEILRFNDLVASDSRVKSVIIPLRDGLTLIYKN